MSCTHTSIDIVSCLRRILDALTSLRGFPISRVERQKEIRRQKTQPLTMHDIRDGGVKRHVAIALERAFQCSSVPHSKFRILDVGCGRGSTVALLRRDGWDAFGAEMNPAQAELARVGLQRAGHSPGVVLDIANGLIDSKDHQFDFVLSEQVVEHVQDLEIFVNETWRVLKPDSRAFHVFPSRWRLLESHVRQPMVHWLPKGRLQSLAVLFWVSLGIEAGSERVVGLSRRGKAIEYSRYLREETFYRSRREIESAFLKKFASLDSDVIGEMVATLRGLSLPMRVPRLQGILQEVCIRFYSSAIFLTKC